MIESRSSPNQVARSGSVLALLLNLLATIHVVWFYLTRVECHIKLVPFEQGRERTPFQYRLLLMEPLRWAHRSPAINALAAWMTSQKAFFPDGARPEGVLEALIDLGSVIVAGLVARRLYLLSSRTGLLSAYVYPLTLLMVLSTYALFTMHSYRFLYDLPSLAFCSLGLYCIYTEAHPLWFAAVFLVGTVNRETTLLLPVFFVLAQCSRPGGFDWRRSYAAATLKTTVPLVALWLAWHVWVAHLYRANISISQPRAALNLGILAVPLTWPQLLATFAYLLPPVILFRAHIHDAVLRGWLWGLPVWFLFMLYYGVLVEIRIFGELIPYLACVAALIAEDKMLLFLEHRRQPLSQSQRGCAAASPAGFAAGGINAIAKGTKIRLSPSRPTIAQPQRESTLLTRVEG